MDDSPPITMLLGRWHAGDHAAFDDLVASLHTQLHGAAAAQMRRLPGVETLRPTALVNEAYLKLRAQADSAYVSRDHFLATAATAMRHILINHARARRAGKRGGGWLQVTFDENAAQQVQDVDTLLALDEALHVLHADRPRLARVVELRFFGGMTEAGIARVLDVTERTVRRDWRKAKALLALSMSGQAPGAAAH